MRIPVSLLTAALLLTSPDVFGADELSELISEATEANPSLEALRAREAELRERASAAGAWPDPVLGVEYSNAPISSLSLADHPMSGLQLKAQQPLRPPGWSAAAREVGDLGVAAAGHDLAEASLQLEVTVRRSWWMLVRVRLLEVVTAAHLARTEELLAVVTDRYAIGGAGQSAVLRMAVLRDRLSDELGEYQRADRELTASLTRALSREPGASFDTPSAVTPLPPPADGDWLMTALTSRPAIAAIESRVQASQASAELARLDAFPDPSVWLGYRLRSVETETDPGVDLISIGVGVPLPTGSARRAKAGQAASLEAARSGEAQLASTEDAVQEEMEATLARWSRSWDKATTYHSQLIPAARSTLEATLADYSVDKAGFASLYEAEVTLLELERAWIGAAVDTHIQQAAATGVLGVPPGETE